MLYYYCSIFPYSQYRLFQFWFRELQVEIELKMIKLPWTYFKISTIKKKLNFCLHGLKQNLNHPFYLKIQVQFFSEKSANKK